MAALMNEAPVVMVSVRSSGKLAEEAQHDGGEAMAGVPAAQVAAVLVRDEAEEHEVEAAKEEHNRHETETFEVGKSAAKTAGLHLGVYSTVLMALVILL